MKLNNKYYILRHGEAVSNVKNIVSSWPETFHNPLTRHGKAMVQEAARKLKDKHIDIMFASDILRTKQTASIVAKALKLAPKFDKRLREVGFGSINGRPAEELLYLGFEAGRIKKSLKKSESYDSVLKRVYGFLKDIDKKYKNKTILIISHQCPLWMLENKVNGFPLTKSIVKKNPEEKRIGRAEVRVLN